MKVGEVLKRNPRAEAPALADYKDKNATTAAAAASE